ncbi:MAG: serine/threonine-protein phosphatase [Prevotella sp.]|nr:serine/threonine-protein phosphatase [Prevotella sp.]
MALITLYADTNIGLRDNNEDNYTVCPDLTLDEWELPENVQVVFPLGRHGSLMVVADGMGGMNAGEVASDIAIRTVQELFAPPVLTSNVTFKQENVKAYLKKVIVEADRRVKQYAEDNPETKGMGSTIVMAWLIGSDAYIAWLGDSRAYSFIPEKGIARLSKDHSYVQELVDAKQLTEEEAMNHDMSNVITRSLGDMSQKAKPDVTVHRVCEGEIIMLCSDGLCGVCTDKEIADVIEENYGSLPQCHEALTESALDAGGSDNITVTLLKAVEVSKENCDLRGKSWLTRLSWKEKGVVAGIVSIAIVILCFLYPRKSHEEEEFLPTEKIILQLNKDTLNYGDTLNYDVTILPDAAEQGYTIKSKDGKLEIDSVNRKIWLKKNVSGTDTLIATAKSDSSKQDIVCIRLKDNNELLHMGTIIPQIIHEVENDMIDTETEHEEEKPSEGEPTLSDQDNQDITGISHVKK